MAIKPSPKRLTEQQLLNPDLDDDGNLDVERFPLPNGEDIEDDYLREVWRAAVKLIKEEEISPQQPVGEIGKEFPTVQAAGRWLAGKWQQLEERYGRKGALAMAVGMLATSPLPGNVAAVIAAAEAIRGVSGWFQRECGGQVEKLNGDPDLATPAMGRRTAPRDYMTAKPAKPAQPGNRPAVARQRRV